MHLSRRNNFDLIRLLAAIQVVIVHGLHHLRLELPAVADHAFDFIKAFPGVPIFFMVSGYLVTLSCQRNSLATYAIHRGLRIFPLLWVSSLLLLTILLFSGVGGTTSLLTWFFGQVTFFQYYTPQELRTFGVGTPNGSLWTIPIEIQFYCLLPFVLYFHRRFGALSIFAIAALAWPIWYLTHNSDRTSPAFLVIKNSVVCYFPLFAIGIFAALYRERVERVFAGRFFEFLIIYLCWWHVARAYGPPIIFAAANPFAYVGAILLGALVFSAAFSSRELSNSILRGNDVSYGVYVFHMPVINMMLEFGMAGSIASVALLAPVTAMLATFSWHFVEKPALSYKL